MNHFTRVTALLSVLTLGLAVVLTAAAGPLGKIKEAANDTRQQMEAADQATEAAATSRPAVAAPADQPAVAVNRAIAVVLPTEGHTAHGTVVFTQTAHGLTVTASVKGLGTHATHGFHIHEFGDISQPDGTGTGGHFNPGHRDHALMDPATGHAGDLGNLVADADGNATYRAEFEGLTLYDGPRAVMGRGVIIHARPDDGGQPTGNAGARIAQGVIGVAASE